MTSFLKLVSFLVGFLAIVAGFANLQGCFADREKVALADLIWNSDGGIPQSTPGFYKFLDTFPPPVDVQREQITHIVKNNLQFENGPRFGGIVRYLANGRRTRGVATFAEVRTWAQHTGYEWYAWIISGAAWLVFAALEIFERVKCKRTG